MVHDSLMSRPNINDQDRRVKRTKMLIFQAFFELVQSSKYYDLKTIHIIEKAGVGKSTFYEHFLNKDDVLQQSLENPMSIIANALFGNIENDKVSKVLSHFWERRVFARVILDHPTHEVVEKCLRKLIIIGFDQTDSVNQNISSATASFLSSGFLSLLKEWLTGKVSLSVEDMTAIISRFSVGSTND